MVVKESIWPAKPEVFIIWPLQEKVDDSSNIYLLHKLLSNLQIKEKTLRENRKYFKQWLRKYSILKSVGYSKNNS